MRTLLISDLDGTLLTSAKALSARTVAVVNRFVAAGGLFSVATARMAHGCDRLIGELDLRLPAIVMNGAALYSFERARYEDERPIQPHEARLVADAVEAAGAGAFVYAVAGGRLRLGYARVADLAWTQYNSTRAQEALGPFDLVGYRAWDRLGSVVYIAVVGTDGQLATVAEALAGRADLAVHPYRNIYTDSDCLEVSSAAAGKQAAVLRLRERVHADRLVVFGDNQNDLGMMAAADVSLAPANALPEALAAAHEIIPGNDDDGVAVAIERHWADWLPADRN